MKRGWLVLLIVSLGLNAGLLARVVIDRAQDRHPGWSRGPGDMREPGDPHGPGGPGGPAATDPLWGRPAERRLDRLAKRLGLDSGQRSSLGEIRRETMISLGGQREAVRRARLALWDSYRAGPADSTAVRANLAALGRAQARVDSCVAAAMLREMALLTAAQRQVYLEELPWERGRPHGAGRGGGRDPG